MKRYLCLIALTAAAFLTACSANLPSAGTAEIAVQTEQTAQTEQTEQTGGMSPQTGAAIGTWEYNLDGIPDLFVIKSPTEAYITVTTETDDLLFDENSSFFYGGKKVPKTDYSFEDGIFLLTYKGKIVLSMEKTSDYDDLYGEYKLTSGVYPDRFKNDDGEYILKDLTLRAQPNQSYITGIRILEGFELAEDCFLYIKDGERIEGNTYTVDGDTMTVTNSEGEKTVMTRKE